MQLRAAARCAFERRRAPRTENLASASLWPSCCLHPSSCPCHFRSGPPASGGRGKGLLFSRPPLPSPPPCPLLARRPTPSVSEHTSARRGSARRRSRRHAELLKAKYYENQLNSLVKYCDQGLVGDPRSYAEFLGKLYGKGAIDFSTAAGLKGSVGVFFAPKKNGAQRIIFDARIANCFFHSASEYQITHCGGLGLSGGARHRGLRRRG